MATLGMRKTAERWLISLPDGEVKEVSGELARFFSVAADPFGDARNGAREATAIPDWSPLDKWCAVRYCEYDYQVAAAVNPKGVIKMVMPNTTYTDAFSVNFSAAGAAAPTQETVDGSFPWETGAITAASVGARFRYVAAGLKANATSAGVHTPGSFRAGNFIGMVHTGAGTWSTYAEMLAACENKSYSAEEGVTVRLANRWNTSVGTYGGTADQWANVAAANQYNRSGWSLPTIVFDGLGDCVIHIKAVEFIEFNAPNGSLLMPTSPSHYDPDCLWAYSRLSDYNIVPVTVAGHSFKSYVSSLASRTARSVAKALKSPLAPVLAGLALGPEAAEGFALGQQVARQVEPKRVAKKTTVAKRRRVRRQKPVA